MEPATNTRVLAAACAAASVSAALSLLVIFIGIAARGAVHGPAIAVFATSMVIIGGGLVHRFESLARTAPTCGDSLTRLRHVRQQILSSEAAVLDAAARILNAAASETRPSAAAPGPGPFAAIPLACTDHGGALVSTAQG